MMQRDAEADRKTGGELQAASAKGDVLSKEDRQKSHRHSQQVSV